MSEHKHTPLQRILVLVTIQPVDALEYSHKELV